MEQAPLGYLVVVFEGVLVEDLGKLHCSEVHNHVQGLVAGELIRLPILTQMVDPTNNVVLYMLPLVRY